MCYVQTAEELMAMAEVFDESEWVILLQKELKNMKKIKLKPRILLENPSKSYHAQHKVTDNDIFDNKRFVDFRRFANPNLFA